MFHLGSTIVAATKNRPSAVKPYFRHKHLLLTPIFIFSVFICLIFSRIMEISVQQYRLCVGVPKFSRLITVQARFQTHGTHLTRYFFSPEGRKQNGIKREKL
jgi:hypothetical protein